MKTTNKRPVRTYFDVIKDKELKNSFDDLWKFICYPDIMYKKKVWIENSLKIQKYNRDEILKMNIFLINRYTDK